MYINNKYTHKDSLKVSRLLLAFVCEWIKNKTNIVN